MPYFLAAAKSSSPCADKQRLVCRDDRLAEFERGQNHRPGESGAADEFGHEMDVRIMDHALPVGGHQGTGNFVGARFVKRLHRHLADGDLDADARSHEPAVELERVKHAAAHGAAANHSQVHLLHRSAQLAAK